MVTRVFSVWRNRQHQSDGSVYRDARRVAAYWSTLESCGVYRWPSESESSVSYRVRSNGDGYRLIRTILQSVTGSWQRPRVGSSCIGGRTQWRAIHRAAATGFHELRRPGKSAVQLVSRVFVATGATFLRVRSWVHCAFVVPTNNKFSNLAERLERTFRLCLINGNRGS